MTRKKAIVLAVVIGACALVGVLVFLLAGQLMDRSMLYQRRNTEGGMTVFSNSVSKRCFVSAYGWDGEEDTRTFTVPDEYDGLPVTTLGGYFGKESSEYFGIWLPNSYMTGDVYDGPVDDIPKAHTVVELPFTMYIGKNLKELRNVNFNLYYAKTEEDDSITFTYPTVYVICDEQNKTFYSQDGKLYDKNGKLVEELAYASERP